MINDVSAEEILTFAGASASACSGVAGRRLLLGFGGAFVGLTFGGSGGGGGLLDDDEAGNSSFLSGDLDFIVTLTFFSCCISSFN